MPDEYEFREVMGHFATGVTIVAGRHPDGAPCGLTVNSVASVSLHPLLVLVCLDRAAASHDGIVDGRAFAISVLSSRDEDLARRFSAGSRTERFQDLPHRVAVTGSPVLEGALAWLDCEVRDVHIAGDHSIVVGEVVACAVGEGDPLVFYRGDYRRIDR
jgi:flavin reductase (DIM6/NTAB) family NADH-FMN oxidoreductase RutF